jgi:hypothetical protein
MVVEHVEGGRERSRSRPIQTRAQAVRGVEGAAAVLGELDMVEFQTRHG